MVEPKGLGSGKVSTADLGGVGSGCVIEPGVRIFGGAFVHLGSQVYLGHNTFMRAYPEGPLFIGDSCWVGPGCFINSYGGVTLGRRVGLGPGVKILSSEHRGQTPGTPIMDTPLLAEEVVVEEGADVGAGAILLPGARVGAFAQVGAGAVVVGVVAAGAVVAGVPARVIEESQRR